MNFEEICARAFGIDQCAGLYGPAGVYVGVPGSDCLVNPEHNGAREVLEIDPVSGAQTGRSTVIPLLQEPGA